MSFSRHSNRKTDEHIPDYRARELEMTAKLRSIDLDDPHRQLSDEKIVELKIRTVIEDACRELRYPPVIDANISQLDGELAAIISSLAEAIRMGKEMTAACACNALTSAIENLSMDISDLDADMAAETMRCRLEYSKDLVLLLQLCREYDNLTFSLKTRTKMRQQKRRELDKIKESYLSRRNSGALDHILQELRLHVATPAAMSEEARALRDELSKLHLLKSAIIGLDIAIDADQVTQNTRGAQIDSRRNALASAPRPRDRKLQARINEADLIYREQLRRELEEAENAIRDYTQHLDNLTDIGRQSVVLTNLAVDLEDRKNQSIAQLQAQLRES